MDKRALWKDERVHLFIKRALWTDEVVVFWTNWQDRLEAMCGCGHTVCGYLTTRLPLPTPFLPHPCPCSHRSGRTVHILDERADWRINGQARLAAMCGCGHKAWLRFSCIFRCSNRFSHTLALAHTVFAHTVFTTRLPLPTPFFPSGVASR